jgi:hypothetical protein
VYFNVTKLFENKFARSDELRAQSDCKAIFISARVQMGWISGSCSLPPGSVVNLEWENLLIRVLSLIDVFFE